MAVPLVYSSYRRAQHELFNMKNLLIVHHSQTGNTRQLAAAARRGIGEVPDLNLDVRYQVAAAAGPEDLRWAHGLLLATPENFGYMSGALKDFFDRTFYAVEGELNPLPYALMISASNDGTGAVRAVERIVGGYPLVAIQPAFIAQGPVTAVHLARAAELGATLAAGLDAGIY